MRQISKTAAKLWSVAISVVLVAWLAHLPPAALQADDQRAEPTVFQSGEKPAKPAAADDLECRIT